MPTTVGLTKDFLALHINFSATEKQKLRVGQLGSALLFQSRRQKCIILYGNHKRLVSLKGQTNNMTLIL